MSFSYLKCSSEELKVLYAAQIVKVFEANLIFFGKTHKINLTKMYCNNYNSLSMTNESNSCFSIFNLILKILSFSESTAVPSLS